MKKITNFVGYMSGDYECFCLCKISFDEWVKRRRKLYRNPPNLKDEEAWQKIGEGYEEIRKLQLYPNHFFPKECSKGKWKFSIIVEAEKVKE